MSSQTHRRRMVVTVVCGITEKNKQKTHLTLGQNSTFAFGFSQVRVRWEEEDQTGNHQSHRPQVCISVFVTTNK